MSEIWKPVPGYGDHYEASSLGRVRVKDRVVEKRSNFADGKVVRQLYKGRLLAPCTRDRLGHQAVHIGVEGKKHLVSVHTLVLLAFVGPRPDGMEACHNNGIAHDNRLENLRWGTHRSNNQDRLRHGTYSRGEAHHQAVLTDEQAREIYERQPSLDDCVRIYGISKSQAFRIKKGQAWTHLHK